MTDFARRIADKTRFHAVYISDDIIPRMMRYLDSSYTELATRDLPDRFRKENVNSNEVRSKLAHICNSYTCKAHRGAAFFDMCLYMCCGVAREMCWEYTHAQKGSNYHL